MPAVAQHPLSNRNANFADADAPAQVIASARRALGHVDILVVNHARSSVGRLAELEAAEIDACLHVNVGRRCFSRRSSRHSTAGSRAGASCY